MPVEVVGRPSNGDGRTPGMLGRVAGGWWEEERVEEGLAMPTFRLRKDIAYWTSNKDYGKG